MKNNIYKITAVSLEKPSLMKAIQIKMFHKIGEGYNGLTSNSDCYLQYISKLFLLPWASEFKFACNVVNAFKTHTANNQLLLHVHVKNYCKCTIFFKRKKNFTY